MNSAEQQHARIEKEWHAITVLANEAGFWAVRRKKEPVPPVVAQWTIRFEGKFIAEVKAASQWDADSSASRQSHEIIFADHLDVNVQFPANFPDGPPVIQVESTIFHPNIAADGIIDVTDIGIVWNSNLSMDLLVERLWNVVRGSHIDLDNPIHVGAGQWYRMQKQVELPIDPRPLSGDQHPNQNIVQYRRKGKKRRGTLPAGSDQERPILILDENTAMQGSQSKTPNDAIHFIE